MADPLARGGAGPVSDWFPGGSDYTALAQTSIYTPFGLRLQQTILSSGAVTIPANVKWVYAVIAGGGAAAFYEYSGGAGQIVWGWTPAQSTCIVGAGSPSQSTAFGGYTRYGHLVALGGCPHNSVAPSTNFFNMPSPDGHVSGLGNAGAQGARGSGGGGGSGISGGGAALVLDSSNGGVGGNGGSGLAGGGGSSYDVSPTGTLAAKKGGDGGSGIGPNGPYTGGTGYSATATGRSPGGGGAGIAGNGSNATSTNGGAGGLGGGGGGGDRGFGAGGKGGDGVIYLFY